MSLTYDELSKHTICTPDQQKRIIEGIKLGMSLTGAARLVGRSREWLKLARKGNPDFARAVQVALGELEERMCSEININVEYDRAPMAAVLIKQRSNRFPNLHGDDPKLRYSIETAGEEHDEDGATAKVQDEGIPPEIRDAILTAYYASKDQP